jgi:hypothetical protein
MAVSLVYLTWLCQWTLNNNFIGGARAATAGAVILIIVEVRQKKMSRALILTCFSMHEISLSGQSN